MEGTHFLKLLVFPPFFDEGKVKKAAFFASFGHLFFFWRGRGVKKCTFLKFLVFPPFPEEGRETEKQRFCNFRPFLPLLFFWRRRGVKRMHVFYNFWPFLLFFWRGVGVKKTHVFLKLWGFSVFFDGKGEWKTHTFFETFRLSTTFWLEESEKNNVFTTFGLFLRGRGLTEHTLFETFSLHCFFFLTGRGGGEKSTRFWNFSSFYHFLTTGEWEKQCFLQLLAFSVIFEGKRSEKHIRFLKLLVFPPLSDEGREKK